MGNPNIKVINNNRKVKQGTAATKSSFRPKETHLHGMTNVYRSGSGTALLFTPCSLPSSFAEIWIRMKSQTHPLPNSSKAPWILPSFLQGMKLITKLLSPIQNSQIAISYTELTISKSVGFSVLKTRNFTWSWEGSNMASAHSFLEALHHTLLWEN